MFLYYFEVFFNLKLIRKNDLNDIHISSPLKYVCFVYVKIRDHPFFMPRPCLQKYGVGHDIARSLSSGWGNIGEYGEHAYKERGYLVFILLNILI